MKKGKAQFTIRLPHGQRTVALREWRPAGTFGSRIPHLASSSRPVVPSSRRPSQTGSVFIIVLWIAFGLVSLALYFADSMNFELRAADNRVSAEAADQAIDGAARYVSYLLQTQILNGSNGCVPFLLDYQCQAVPVGDARFWLIGRDTNNLASSSSVCFGLVDESSKLNLNYTPSNALVWLPRMTLDLTQSIVDWRSTNSSGPTV